MSDVYLISVDKISIQTTITSFSASTTGWVAAALKVFPAAANHASFKMQTKRAIARKKGWIIDETLQ